MDCSYRAFIPYDDPLNYRLSMMTRSNVGVVVKTAGLSMGTVIDHEASDRGVWIWPHCRRGVSIRARKNPIRENEGGR